MKKHYPHQRKGGYLNVMEKGDPALPGAGRPKGSLGTKTIIKRWLAAKQKGKDPFNRNNEVELNQLDVMVLALIQKARKGDVQAFNALMDRFEGKPLQNLDIVTKTRFIARVSDDVEDSSPVDDE